MDSCVVSQSRSITVAWKQYFTEHLLLSLRQRRALALVLPFLLLEVPVHARRLPLPTRPRFVAEEEAVLTTDGELILEELRVQLLSSWEPLERRREVNRHHKSQSPMHVATCNQLLDIA